MVITFIEEMRLHLRIEEGAKDCNGSSKGVDRLNWRMEDKDGRDNNRDSLHCVPNAKC